MKHHEPVEGYTLWSNFGPMSLLETPHTFESLTEYMQKKLVHVPLEKMLIQRNPIIGGWSVYLHNDYAYICEDLNRGVEELLKLYKRAHGIEW